MKNWLRQHRIRLQFALRMTLAALASYALGEALGLGQVYWAVLSAIIVIQGSVGGSLTTGINRLVGTVGGAVWGAIVSILLPHQGMSWALVALTAAAAPLAILTAYYPIYRVAPITAIIVLMGAPMEHPDPIASAISRVVEISLGSVVAIAVALFIFPARAHRLLASAASRVVAAMSELTGLLGAAAMGGAAPAKLEGVYTRIRLGVAQTETRAEEARIERSNKLSDAPDPEPMARTLRRLRHDLVMLARTLHSPFSQEVRAMLGPSMGAVLSELAAWLTATSKALASAGPAPSLEAVRSVLGEYRMAVEKFERDPSLPESVRADAYRVYAMLFILEQMMQNLKDLADRTAELSEAGPATNQDTPGAERASAS